MITENPQQPLVSAIIPVKNGSKTLTQCIRSVKRSYYRNFEIIVIDDHSSDNSADIARGLQCTVIAATDGTGAISAELSDE